MSRVGKLVKDTLRPSPFHYVVFIAGAVFFLAFAARLYFGGGPGGLNVRYRDRKPVAARTSPAEREVESRMYLADEDRSVRYADRLRDASQIAYACGLYAVRQRTGYQRTIPDIVTLMNELEKTPLMPPVVTGARVLKYRDGTERAVLQTPTGLYYVSYRPTPLAFDVLAAGERGLDDGAVFVVRMPEASGTIARGQNPPARGVFASVFVAPYQNAVVPLPFSPADAYRAAGWAQEPVRSAPVSADELAEINRFLAGAGGQQ